MIEDTKLYLKMLYAHLFSILDRACDGNLSGPDQVLGCDAQTVFYTWRNKPHYLEFEIHRDTHSIEVFYHNRGTGELWEKIFDVKDEHDPYVKIAQDLGVQRYLKNFYKEDEEKIG